MRILYLNHNVAGTGTYQRAVNVAHEAVRRGHEAVLFTTSRTRMWRGERRVLDGVHVVEAPDLLRGGARNGWDAWNAAWRSSRLAGQHFDLVHGFDARPVVIAPALIARAMTRAPLILDWADWWGRGGVIGERSGWLVRTFFGPIETWFEESFRTRVTANTVISESLKERCASLGVAPERILLMPNGCTSPRPVSAAERSQARRRFGLSEDTPVVLHIGSMDRGDARLLCDAFALVRERMRETRLVLVGNTRVPVQEVSRPGVRSLGFVDGNTLRSWLAAADVATVVLRTNIASAARWPGKINDYFSAGLPVVMPRVGGAARWVESHGAGLTCEPHPRSYADALLSLLGDRPLRDTAGAQALELAAGPLSWTRVADPLFEFYNRWCSGFQEGEGEQPAVSAA